MAEMVRTVVDIRGDMAGFFGACAVLYPKEMSRAIRHTAYMTTTRMKAEFLAEIPGGHHIQTLSHIQRRRVLDMFKEGGRGKNGSVRFKRARGLAYGMSGGHTWPMGGKLAQSIKYRMADAEVPLTASIGWLDKAAARSGLLFEKGQSTTVTPKVRRLFQAAGILLGSTRTIEQPERPVMRLFYEGRRQWMGRILLDRIHRNINQVSARTASQMIRRAAAHNVV